MCVQAKSSPLDLLLESSRCGSRYNPSPPMSEGRLFKLKGRKRGKRSISLGVTIYYHVLFPEGWKQKVLLHQQSQRSSLYSLYFFTLGPSSKAREGVSFSIDSPLTRTGIQSHTRSSSISPPQSTIYSCTDTPVGCLWEWCSSVLWQF